MYDSLTDTVRPTGNMIRARHWHTASVLRNGTVLVAGGVNIYEARRSAELYNPSTGTWRRTRRMRYL